MRSILFVIPGLNLKVFGFSAALIVALFGAVFLTAWRARREKLNPDAVYDLACWLIPGGVVGARLFFLAEYPQTIHHFTDIFKVWQGGIVFYGCILGGLIGSVIYWFRRPFPFRPMADAVAPSLALAAGIGRIGCYLNGCCYGDPCTLPWAVRFPAGSLPWLDHLRNGWILPSALVSLPVHPTQLYAVFDGLVLLLLLTAYYPLRRRDGEVMALLMVTYPLSRFLIERLRNDEAAFFAGLTISQNISVAVFVLGLLFWLYLARLPRGRYADETSAPHAIAPRPEMMLHAGR